MKKPIDTVQIRGVCDLRSNNLDYWRDTARKFIPELADEIDRLRAENERMEKVRILLLMHLNDICAAHISEDEDGMIESIELAQKAITKSILGGADDDH